MGWFGSRAGLKVTKRVSVTVNGQPINVPNTGELPDLNAIVQSALASAGVPTGPDGHVTAPIVSAEAILASGRSGNATLLGTFTPTTGVMKEGHTSIGLMLNVVIDGQPPYQVQTIPVVPNDKIHALTPGALLPVKVDVNTPLLVVVDWAAVS